MVALTLLLVVLAGLRFSRMDVLGTSFFATDPYYTRVTDEGREITNLNIDIVQYLSMVEDFRGEPDAFERHRPTEEFLRTGGSAEEGGPVVGPVSPFIYRPALPWLASLLPMDSANAFALTNLVLVVGGLWLLVDALRRSGRSPTAQLAGGLLYTVAVPVVVFTTSLFIDGGTMAVLVLGYWLMVRRWWWAVVVFVPLSYLVKEPLLVVGIASAWAWRTTGHRFRDPRFITGAVVAAGGWLAVAVGVRLTAPEPAYSFTVLPQLHFLQWNLTRPTSVVFFAIGTLPVLVPAVLFLRRRARDGWSELLHSAAGPDIVGLGVLAAVNVYSVVSTDLTLRTGWLMYPFAIGLAARWVDDLVHTRQPDWSRRLERVVAGHSA
jgi:hypothetical protein